MERERKKYFKSWKNEYERHDRAKSRKELEKEKDGMHTSLGHLIRPICLRTRRSLSLSL